MIVPRPRSLVTTRTLSFTRAPLRPILARFTRTLKAGRRFVMLRGPVDYDVTAAPINLPRQLFITGETGAPRPVIRATNLTAINVTNGVFTDSGKPTALTAARGKPKPKKGTSFRFTLSEAARVSIRIERVLAGRRKGKRCVKPTPKLRKAKRCDRFSRKGTLVRSSKQGSNSVAFSGRLGSKPLARGADRAVLTATGNASKEAKVSFRVVKAR